MEVVEGLDALRRIGSGGFADVYEAHERAFSRNVAVKVFRAPLQTDDRGSFDQESQAMGRLSGIRNVVQVHRSGVTDSGHPYLVMELMSGSLEDVVAAGPIPVDKACTAGALVGDALSEAHTRGVLHRDLKPANILIDRYGEPNLSDFGIASLNDLAASVDLQAFTAEHAAPELFSEARSTPASDVYSLASTVYTMIEGHPPFARVSGEGPVAFMTRVGRTPCPHSQSALIVDPELDSLLLQALAKSPDERPALDEFVTGLKRWADPGRLALDFPGDARDQRAIEGERTEPPPASTPQAEVSKGADHRRRLLVVTSVLLLGILAVAAFAFLGSGDRDADADGSAAGRETQGEASTTTATEATTTPSDSSIPRRKDGISNVAPATDPDLADTSGMLRARLNAFAASSGSPAVGAGPMDEPTGVDLGFGATPATFDYAATNASTTNECQRIYLDDMTVLGAAAAVWFNGEQLVLVNTVQMSSEQQARQYYWATVMFLGFRDDQCDGWPANQIAVNPEHLQIDRVEFPITSSPDDLFTTIDDSPSVGVLKAGIAYPAVFRSGDVIGVVSVTWAQGASAAGPEQAAAIVDEVIDAFGSE